MAPWWLLVPALLPLELLLLQLILAGADPGPAPLLEMLLLWALAVAAPLRVLLHAARPMGLVLGALAGLLQAPPLIWLDARAGQVALATPWHGSSRLGVLLQAGVVLSVLQVQIAQLLLSVPGPSVPGTVTVQADERRTDDKRQQLNAEVLTSDDITGTEPEQHGCEADGSRSEEGEPESPA